MKNDESIKRKPTWDEVLSYSDTIKGPMTDDQIREGWRMMMEMDMSTIPDEADMDDDEWRKEKAKTKAATKRNNGNDGR